MPKSPHLSNHFAFIQQTWSLYTHKSAACCLSVIAIKADMMDGPAVDFSPPATLEQHIL